MAIATKENKKKKHSENKEMRKLLLQMRETNNTKMEQVSAQNDRLLSELALVQKDMDEMKSVLARLKPVSPPSRRMGLFSRRRKNVPITVEPEVKPKLSLPLEEILPLLPQLGGVIPQLNNPKVKETMKLLGNPAIMGMIQQFLANGGLNGLKGLNGLSGLTGLKGIQTLPKGRG